MADYILLAIVFISSCLGTWCIIWLARTHHWLDKPDHRSSHSNPTPTGGGLAFVIVCLAALVYLFSSRNPGFNYEVMVWLALLIAGLGVLDDVFNLGVLPRFFVQLVVVLGTLFFFPLPDFQVFSYSFEPGLLAYPLLAIVYIWFINLYNFMDGIDGIAASEALFVCGAVLLLTPGSDSWGVSMLLLVLCVSVTGFLCFNYSPARIFMGDTGSNFLGYMIGIAAINSTASELSNVWVWGILAGVFIVDATYTLIARISSKEPWYQAHRSHAYQLAAMRHSSHGRVVLTVQAINLCWLLPLAWTAHHYPAWGLLLTCIAWGPLVIIVHRVRAGKGSFTALHGDTRS